MADAVGAGVRVRKGLQGPASSGPVFRCFQGGYRRGTVVTEYSPKMEQSLLQTPSYLGD